MRKSIADHQHGVRHAAVATAADQPINYSLVLVAGHSKVSRIVVSRIVERTGSRAAAGTPSEALALLDAVRPVVVILDGGADNRQCDAVLEKLTGPRRASSLDLPKVILLTTSNGTPETLAPGKLVDAVVAKPLTVERLQPLVARMIEDARAGRQPAALSFGGSARL